MIAAHSAFITAIDHARIYNLDSSPVRIRIWSELKSEKNYYQFFQSHKNEFRMFYVKHSKSKRIRHFIASDPYFVSRETITCSSWEPAASDRPYKAAEVQGS